MKTQKMLTIEIDHVSLRGDITIPENPLGLIVFVCGSSNGRFSLRNNFVAAQLQRYGLATFLFDLLTKDEDEWHANRFDIDLLSDRLISVTRWLMKYPLTNTLPIGFFGASIGVSAALSAEAELKDAIFAVVSRGGRPDLVKEKLSYVKCPTLLIVGERDHDVLNFNKQALDKLAEPKKLKQIYSATHLFEEPGTLAEVAKFAIAWFVQYLPKLNKVSRKKSKEELTIFE